MSIKLAVFASGRGSNLEAIIAAIKNNKLNASIEIVVSNNPEAKALDIAKSANIQTLVVANKKDRQEHEKLILREFANHKIDFVVLAGYMRILTPYFLEYFKSKEGFYKVINIHPSLLPAFPGKQAYEDAFAYGVKISGITVHLVDSQVDHGPILAQAIFPRHKDDTLETFKARGLAVEHSLYPETLQSIAQFGITNLLTQQSKPMVNVND